VQKEQLNEAQNPKEAQTSKQDLIEIVQELNNDTALNTKVKFGFHDESSTYFVSVRDAKTDEVIRKYPSDEAMSLAAKMRQLSRGLVDLQA
jgi:flagellar protein FlaG